MLEEAGKTGLTFALQDYAINLNCDLSDERTWDRLSELKDQIYGDLAKQKFPPAMVSHARHLLLRQYGLSERQKHRQIQDAIDLLIFAAKAGNRDAASDLEREYRRGGNVPVNGREMEYWDEKKTEIRARGRHCPRDAYGINELLDSGWLATDDCRLVPEQ